LSAAVVLCLIVTVAFCPSSLLLPCPSHRCHHSGTSSPSALSPCLPYCRHCCHIVLVIIVATIAPCVSISLLSLPRAPRHHHLIAVTSHTSSSSLRAPRPHHLAHLITIALCATSLLPCAPCCCCPACLEDALHLEPVPPSSRNTDEVLSTMIAQSSKCKLCSMCSDKGSTTKHSCVGGTKEHTLPAVCLVDLGSIDPCVENMLEFISMPLAHPEVYLHTNMQPSCGVLLHGPPSCGKTMLKNAIGGGGTLSRNWVCHLLWFWCR